MKKLQLNKQTIAQLNEPGRIYGGTDKTIASDQSYKPCPLTDTPACCVIPVTTKTVGCTV
ncbi:MAG: class I lanthipeptide [Bacteroidetes bacterium]|nr:class I lanthipeptide [Bacteroidota bacterium]MCL2303512.1 class I lanthipeptide [Lentimicrobiaceae bacterium]